MSSLKKKVQSLDLRADFLFSVFVTFVVSCEAAAQGIGFLTESGSGIHWNLPCAWLWVDGHEGKGEGKWGVSNLQQTMSQLRNLRTKTGPDLQSLLEPQGIGF